MSLGLCSMFAKRNVDLLTLNDLSKHSPLRGTEVQNIEGYDSYMSEIVRALERESIAYSGGLRSRGWASVLEVIGVMKVWLDPE